MDSSGSVLGPLVRFYENSNETLSSMMSWNFLTS